MLLPNLQLIQFGGMPKDAKPFKGVGRGVVEIALQRYKEARELADEDKENDEN